ncbi:MAG: hypothetical protein J6Y57_09920 [Lachnospiraceae bacterium]|nr:hypothetical protein [Lachnospiraceae bacterium]
MKKMTVVYDDSRIPERMIRNITGNKSFGETIFKRIPLRDRMERICMRIPVCGGFAGKGEKITADSPDAILKLYSDMVIRDEEAFAILAEKSLYAKECYKVVQDDKIACVIYPDAQHYLASAPTDEAGFAAIPTDAFSDLSSVGAFRQFITDGFDARFFNELSGDDFTVVKHSANIEKLHREYTFYGLLPDDMKMWFAMPFSYREEDGSASYAMERYHMTDLAIRYVHGAIGTDEFRSIMEKLFHFITTRRHKTVPEDVYRKCTQELYVDKVRRRIEELKKHPACGKLNALLASGARFADIDAVYTYYLDVYAQMTRKRKTESVLAIGHGDLCFSNILYSDEASFIKLIDPKGAMTEEELYTDPYYDLAKLSHSILGSYDYFNSDLFEICVNEKMELQLRVDCSNEAYAAVFRDYLDRYHMDLPLIRLYEASLFLSMLPLHIDREKKVLAFILNAIRILEGIAHE